MSNRLRSAATPKSIPNQLVNGLAIDTFNNCRAVIEYVRQATVADHSEETTYGEYLILGLVHDALGTLEAELQRPANPANEPPRFTPRVVEGGGQ